MRNARFFVKPSSVRLDLGQIVFEDPEQVGQLSRVLRAKIGDTVEVLDDSGWLYVCLLEEITRSFIKAKIVSATDKGDVSQTEIILGLPILKGGRFEWILEKACELGASRIVPLVFERSVIRKADESKIEHWQKILREAAEQSERPFLPKISLAQDFADFLKTFASASEPLFLCAERADVPPLSRLLYGYRIESVCPKRVCIVVGPEGGLTEAEIKLGAQVSTLVSLGRQILRSETAAIFALSQVVAETTSDSCP